MLRDYLGAYSEHPERLHTHGDTDPPTCANDRSSLARYAGVGAENRGVANDLH